MDAGSQRFLNCLAFSLMATRLQMQCQRRRYWLFVIIADRLENGESEPVSISLSLPISA